MMICYSSTMLRLAVLLCSLKYSMCAGPSPCECECPNYDGIDVKQIKYDEEEQCPETCCSAEVSKSVDTEHVEHMETAKGCGIRNAAGFVYKVLGNNTTNEAEYGSYIQYFDQNLKRHETMLLAEFPWMVGIFKEDLFLNRSFETIQCGGSLIHPSVVLTAAHCVNGKEEVSLKIRAGQWDIEALDEIYPVQKRQVKEYLVHEKYHKGAQSNGIALIFLEKPVTIAPNVNLICLPPQNQSFDMQRCYAAGWGKNAFGEEGEYQKKLKRVELPIVPRDKCQIELRKTRLGQNFNLHDSFLCAGGEREDADTCEGDGGSPLFCPLPNSQIFNVKYFQAGIVSWVSVTCLCITKNVVNSNVNALFFRVLDVVTKSQVNVVSF